MPWIEEGKCKTCGAPIKKWVEPPTEESIEEHKRSMTNHLYWMAQQIYIDRANRAARSGLGL